MSEFRMKICGMTLEGNGVVWGVLVVLGSCVLFHRAFLRKWLPVKVMLMEVQVFWW